MKSGLDIFLFKLNIFRSTKIQSFVSLGYMTEIHSATSDDSSNVYLSGWSLDNNDSSRNIIIKLNPSGNLVYCKAWINDGAPDIKYHNGFIYSAGGSKIFDTAFYSPCYNPDTMIGIIFSGPSTQSSGFTASYPTINYMPANLPTPVSNLVSPSLRFDLCTQNGIAKEKYCHFLRIFPNPTSDKVEIDVNGNSTTRYNLEILNQIGELVYTVNFSKQSITVDCRSLQKGIYFLKINCSEWSEVKKLIVQ